MPLRRLVDPGILEITDAGLALETAGLLDPIALDPDVGPQSAVPQGAIPRSPVIIAIIDDGIGIANHRFRKAATETRVEHFLDLSLVGTPRAGGARRRVVGPELDRGRNQRAARRFPDDEERVYRALGLIDTSVALRQPLRAAVSHGTHILDTAAGYDWRTEQGEARRSPDHRRSTADSRPPRIAPTLDAAIAEAGTGLDSGQGGRALRQDHQRRSERLPLIVNCSFSSMAGPQDGWSDVERRITQFVRTYRAGGVPELCTVVMSAGNSLQLPRRRPGPDR